MNSVDKSKQEVEHKEAELKKLIEEKEKVSQAIGSLQKDRGQAVRDLAASGDEAKSGPLRKKILQIESSLSPLSLRMEGLESLIKEAEQEVERARGALVEAEKEREERRKGFETEETEKNNQALLDNLPKLFESAKEAARILQTSFGEMMKVWAILESQGQATFEAQRVAAEFIRNVPSRIDQYSKEINLFPLDSPGVGMHPVEMRPCLIPPPGFGGNPGYVRVHAQHYERDRVEKLRMQFDTKNQ